MSVTEVAVLDRETFAELGATAIREHSLARLAAEEVVRHAILAGKALQEIKSGLPYGKWQLWLDSSTDITRTVANTYMRLATYELIIGDAPTIQAANGLLKGLPRAACTPARTWMEDAVRLRDSGLSYEAIAPLVGRTKMAIYKALNPDYYTREKARYTANAKQRADEKKALVLLTRLQAAKAAGVSEAYSLLRRALQALEELVEDGPSLAIRQTAELARKDVARAEGRISLVVTQDTA